MKLEEQLRQIIIGSKQSLIELQRSTGVDRSTLSALKRGGKVSQAVLQKLQAKLLPAAPAPVNVFAQAAQKAAVEQSTTEKTHNGKGTTWYVDKPDIQPDEWVEYRPKRATKRASKVILTEGGDLIIPHHLCAQYRLYDGVKVTLYYNATKHSVAIVNPKKGGTVMVHDHSNDARRAVRISISGLLRQHSIHVTGTSRLRVSADPTLLIVALAGGIL